MDLLDLATKIGAYAGVAAFLFGALLISLYLSGSRDVRRLREWSELTPDRDTAELQAAQAAGRAGPPPQTPAGAVVSTRPTAAQRVARELPAAARVTAERPALVLREPWWRRFLRRPDPRYLVAIVGGVLALGIAVAVVAVQISEEPQREPRRPEPAIAPADVTVAVLNSTAIPGLADKVGDDVAAGGFQIGAIANSPSPSEHSIVMFERGHEREAELVGKQLGIRQIEPIDGETRETVEEATPDAESASVVIIAGDDRTGI